jgi:hypothetical protein
VALDALADLGEEKKRDFLLAVILFHSQFNSDKLAPYCPTVIREVMKYVRRVGLQTVQCKQFMGYVHIELNKRNLSLQQILSQ